jgi:hypothetical protein
MRIVNHNLLYQKTLGLSNDGGLKNDSWLMAHRQTPMSHPMSHRLFYKKSSELPQSTSDELLSLIFPIGVVNPSTSFPNMAIQITAATIKTTGKWPDIQTIILSNMMSSLSG